MRGLGCALGVTDENNRGQGEKTEINTTTKAHGKTYKGRKTKADTDRTKERQGRSRQDRKPFLQLVLVSL